MESKDFDEITDDNKEKEGLFLKNILKYITKYKVGQYIPIVLSIPLLFDLCRTSMTLKSINKYIECNFNDSHYDAYCDEDFKYIFDYVHNEISSSREFLSYDREEIGVLIRDTTKMIDYEDLLYGEKIKHLHLIIKNNTKHKEIKELLRNSSFSRYNDASITLDFDKGVSSEIQQEYIDIMSGLKNIKCIEIHTNKVNELNYRNLDIPELELQDNSFSSDITYTIELNRAVEKLKLRIRYSEEFEEEIKLKTIKVDSDNTNLYLECGLINRNIVYTDNYGNLTGIIDDNTHIFLPENSNLKIKDFLLSNITQSANLFNDCRDLNSVLVDDFYYNKDSMDYDKEIEELFGDEEKQRHLIYH